MRKRPLYDSVLSGKNLQVKDMGDLGAALRRRRRELGMTQREASGLTGVSVALLSDVERGERENVSFGTVLRIVQTLGLDLTLEPRARQHAKGTT